jgi:signal transduction histidine kinase
VEKALVSSPKQFIGGTKVVDMVSPFHFTGSTPGLLLLIISISDSAGGIPEAIIDKLFEPYFTTKHQSQGTGIGLYMSEEIIRKHMRGTITASNTEFEINGNIYTGAKFTIKIPFVSVEI